MNFVKYYIEHFAPKASSSSSLMQDFYPDLLSNQDYSTSLDSINRDYFGDLSTPAVVVQTQDVIKTTKYSLANSTFPAEDIVVLPPGGFTCWDKVCLSV